MAGALVVMDTLRDPSQSGKAHDGPLCHISGRGVPVVRLFLFFFSFPCPATFHGGFRFKKKKKALASWKETKKKLSLTAVEIESHASLFQFRYQQHRRRKGGIDYAMQLNSCPCAVCVPFLCCPRTARTKALSVGLVCLYNITVMCSFPLENKKRN